MVVEQGSDGAGNAGGAAATGGETGGVAAASAGGGEKPAAGSTDGGDDAAAAAAAAAPAYTPNYKYTVQRQEKEIPEWARPFVTSAEIEKQVRETFERADGLDVVKSHRDQMIEENRTMRETYTPIVQDVQLARDLLEKKDYGALFSFLAIPPLDILRHAQQLVAAQDNPLLADQMLNGAATRLHNLKLTQHLQNTQNDSTANAVAAAYQEIDDRLALPTAAPVVAAFDARMGKPGAFRAEVIRRGQAYVNSGAGISVEQNVNDLLAMIGGVAGGTAAPSPAPAANAFAAGNAPAAGGGTPAASAGGKAPLPTLPNIRGKGGSPAKRTNLSLDEMRQKGRELAAQGR